MKKIKNIFLFGSLLALIVSPFGLNRAFAADSDTVTLGSFVIAGMVASQSTPSWFNSGDWDGWMSISRDSTITVTKAQAKEITGLYMDDLTPIMFAPDELGDYFSNFTGLEYLTNLESIGMDDGNLNHGIWSYAFSKEQLNVSYKPIVEYFLTKTTDEIDTTWPKLNLDSFVSSTTYSGHKYFFPEDKIQQNLIIPKVEANRDKLLLDIENSGLTSEKIADLKERTNYSATAMISDIKNTHYYYLRRKDLNSEYDFNAIRAELQKEIDAIDKPSAVDKSTETAGVLISIDTKVSETAKAPNTGFNNHNSDIMLPIIISGASTIILSIIIVLKIKKGSKVKL